MKPKFNGEYSRNKLSNIKDGTYVINHDKYKLIGTHWIALYMNAHNVGPSYDVKYFGSFGIEHIPKDI